MIFFRYFARMCGWVGCDRRQAITRATFRYKAVFALVVTILAFFCCCQYLFPLYTNPTVSWFVCYRVVFREQAKVHFRLGK